MVLADVHCILAALVQNEFELCLKEAREKGKFGMVNKYESL